MPRCASCGEWLEGSDKCPKCGKRFRHSVGGDGSKTHAARAKAPTPEPTRYQGAQSALASTRRRRGLRLLTIVLVAAVGCLAVALAASLMLDIGSDRRSQTELDSAQRQGQALQVKLNTVEAQLKKAESGFSGLKDSFRILQKQYRALYKKYDRQGGSHLAENYAALQANYDDLLARYLFLFNGGGGRAEVE